MQWFYFDALEALPVDSSEFPEDVVKATGSRYDAQVAVFGHDMQKKLEKTKCFVVRLIPTRLDHLGPEIKGVSLPPTTDVMVM